MVSDYKTKSGRRGKYYVNGFTNGAVLYNNSNLLEGICYSEWLIEEGFEVEPFLDFNLKLFIKWAKRKIKQAKGREKL
jgi:hypothetical protein